MRKPTPVEFIKMLNFRWPIIGLPFTLGLIFFWTVREILRSKTDQEKEWERHTEELRRIFHEC